MFCGDRSGSPALRIWEPSALRSMVKPGRKRGAGGEGASQKPPLKAEARLLGLSQERDKKGGLMWKGSDKRVPGCRDEQ